MLTAIYNFGISYAFALLAGFIFMFPAKLGVR